MQWLAISMIASRASLQFSKGAWAGVASKQQTAGKPVNSFLIICESEPIESNLHSQQGQL
jgi:hypothetical protein